MSIQSSTTHEQVAGGADASADRYARKALIASNVGYAMDGFDLMILSFMLPAVVAGLHLTGSEAGSLITWTRTILLFAVFTGLCAFAQGYWDLLIYRTIAGIGLGGEFGIGMALVAEAWPAHKRARASSYVALGWQAGVLSAALLTPLLLPLIGWRGMFLVGLVPAVIAFGLRRYLHEPELFVKAAKKEEGRGTNPYSYLFANREATRSTIGIGIMTSIQNFGYYGMMIWLPSYLSTQLGFSLTRSALWISVTVIGGAFGMWLFGQLADRIGRKPLFVGLRCADLGELSDPGPSDGTERAVQYRPRRWRVWSAGDRLAGDTVFAVGRAVVPGFCLGARHRRHRVPDQGTQGRTTRLIG